MRRRAALLLLALAAGADVAACGGRQRTASPTSPLPPARERHPAQEGMASWYGADFRGRKTASGERFNPNDFTAAHLHLPFGTKVRVTNLKNGRSVEVRINDRGPYGGRGIIDLSRAAAKELGIIETGRAPVRLEVLWMP